MIANVVIGLALAGAGMLKMSDSVQSREHQARLAYHLFRREKEMEQLHRSYGAYSGNDMFTKARLWLSDSRWFLGLRSMIEYKTKLIKDVMHDNWIPLALTAIGLTVAFGPGMWPLMARFGGRFLGGGLKMFGGLASKAIQAIPPLGGIFTPLLNSIQNVSPLGAMGLLGGAGMAAIYGKTLMGEFSGDNKRQYVGDMVNVGPQDDYRSSFSDGLI